METIPMISVMTTDFGDYVIPPSVAAKINDMPETLYWSPYAEPGDPPLVIKDMNHPPLARYYRLVQRHMQRQWLTGEIGAAA